MRRPHWLAVDEAKKAEAAALPIPRETGGIILITVNPATLARAALDAVNLVVTTRDGAADTLRTFAEATQRSPPVVPESVGGAVLWRVGETDAVPIDVAPARRDHLRHQRKYARGDVGKDKSFYFRRPRGTLRLRAQNLQLFVQMAEGVYDETSLYHLRAGDYSRWFRDAIKDGALADDAGTVEESPGMPAGESLARIRTAIEKRYTLPA